MKVIGLIPTRLNSTRLPHKSLLPINGIPMIIHTYKRSKLAKKLDDLIICCDDKKIMDIFDNSVGYSIEAFPSSHLWNPYHGFENIKKKMMFEDKTLADVAGEKTANDVFQILTKNGVNEEYATKIKPWAAMFSIAAIY